MCRELLRKTSKDASAASRLRSGSRSSIIGYGRMMLSQPAFDEPGFVIA